MQTPHFSKNIVLKAAIDEGILLARSRLNSSARRALGTAFHSFTVSLTPFKPKAELVLTDNLVISDAVIGFHSENLSTERLS